MPTLLETLASYVPASIARKAAEDPARFERPTSETFDAAVLFADISGFTALTERLAVRGAAGAEDLTRLLNAYLGQLVELVHGHGGDIVKFAGDSVLALWPVSQSGGDAATAVRRAARCALAVQERLHDYSVAEDVRLSLKLSVGTGPVVEATLGGIFGRWEFLVAGRPLPEVGASNAQALPGQVVLAPSAWALVAGAAEGEPLMDGHVLLASVRETSDPVPVPAVAVPDEAAPALRAFIPAAIRNRLDAGQSDWLAELRRVTVVFVNLLDLTHRTPLEEAQETMLTLQTNLYRYEGSINKLSVDDKGASLIAVLGLPPLAHEDDPARGVRAAIAMREALERMGRHCSVGVTSGLAFCGSVGGERRREYTIMGDVVNLAARLMQAAAGGILCDAATAEAAAGRLSFEPLATMKVKGKKEPIAVYRPSAEETSPGPGARAAERGEMVGRDRERDRIATRIDALVGARESGLVVVEGEAGIGKSRLVESALALAAERGASALEGAGDSIESSTPYFAWRRVFAGLLALEDLPARGNARRTYVLAQLPPDEEALRAAPLLDAVLPFDWPDNEYTSGLAGKGRADATRDLLVRVLQQAASRRPVVLAVEDAHWLDSGSLALLAEVAERVRPLLVVVATRPVADPAPAEYRRLLAAPGAELIRLERLSKEATVELASRSLGVDAIPPPASLVIADKAEGNPFFAEELAYAMRDAGLLVVDGAACRVSPEAGKTNSWDFPTTIQGIITSRIDRLTPEQQLTVKVASVVGRAFSLRTLRDVHPVEGERDRLHDHVEVLRGLDLTPIERPAPELEYVFKHVITHDVAYNLMAFEQRRQIHRAVAEWYERAYAEDLEPYYPYLAYHWRKAAEDRTPDPALLAKAVDYYELAGDGAVRAYVNREAIDFYDDALGLLGKLPESAARDARELRLRLSSGAVLIAARGYASEEVRAAYARARELSGGVGDEELHFTALRGLWAYATGRADYHAARDLGREMLALAERDGRAAYRLEAHRALGNTAFWLGELDAAREQMERGIEIYEPDRDRALALQFGQDPDVANRGMQAWPLSLMGYPERALARGREALARARELGHPYSVGYALVHDMCCHQYLRLSDGVRERADEVVALASEKSFPNWLLAGRVLRGWAAARGGDAERGAAEIREATGLWRSSGSELVVPYFGALLAEACLDGGRADEGLEALAEAREVARRNDDLWFEPEMHRIEGELRRVRGDAAGDVEACFERALESAQARGAMLLELRAAVALGGLRRESGREAGARDLVSGVFARFSEGFGLPDLVDARSFVERDATA